MKKREHNRTGFTILELMVVIVIMGILGGILTINLVGAADRAKVGATKTSMKAVKAALTMYQTQYSSYPPTGSLSTSFAFPHWLTPICRDTRWS